MGRNDPSGVWVSLVLLHRVGLSSKAMLWGRRFSGEQTEVPGSYCASHLCIQLLSPSSPSVFLQELEPSGRLCLPAPAQSPKILCKCWPWCPSTVFAPRLKPEACVLETVTREESEQCLSGPGVWVRCVRVSDGVRMGWRLPALGRWRELWFVQCHGWTVSVVQASNARRRLLEVGRTVG